MTATIQNAIYCNFQCIASRKHYKTFPRYIFLIWIDAVNSDRKVCFFWQFNPVQIIFLQTSKIAWRGAYLISCYISVYSPSPTGAESDGHAVWGKAEPSALAKGNVEFSAASDFKTAESDGHAVWGETEPSALAKGNVEFSAASDFKTAESDGHAVWGKAEPNALAEGNVEFSKSLRQL